MVKSTVGPMVAPTYCELAVCAQRCQGFPITSWAGVTQSHAPTGWPHGMGTAIPGSHCRGGAHSASPTWSQGAQRGRRHRSTGLGLRLLPAASASKQLRRPGDPTGRASDVSQLGPDSPSWEPAAATSRKPSISLALEVSLTGCHAHWATSVPCHPGHITWIARASCGSWGAERPKILSEGAERARVRGHGLRARDRAWCPLLVSAPIWEASSVNKWPQL